MTQVAESCDAAQAAQAVHLSALAAMWAAKRRGLGIVAASARPQEPQRRTARPVATSRIHPALTPARELELIEAYRHGSRTAGDAVLRAYEPLITHYACRFARRGAEKSEAAQVGRIGLLRAMDKHDRAKGAFIKYAWHFIYFAMVKAARRSDIDSLDEPIFDDGDPLVERLPALCGNPEEILILAEELGL